MYSIAAGKWVDVYHHTGITNAATATANIDTMGYDSCHILVHMGTSNDVTNNPSVFKLAESDDTVVTNFANISGFVGDTDWTIPTYATDAANLTVFNVDCRGRKRYLRLSISPVTTQAIHVSAVLSRGTKSSDTSATVAGVGALVSG